MRSPLRLAAVALLGAAALAVSATSANAAFSWNIVTDNSARATTDIFPRFRIINSSPGALYGRAPTVTSGGGIINFDFTNGLSLDFGSQVNSSTNINQSTDGKLILTLHFSSPTSIIANIAEGGVYNTTGNGSVNIAGGEFVMEAVNAPYTEHHATSLKAVLNDGDWTATASTGPFNGVFTDYRLVIDNDLEATATSGTASISKTSFTITITDGGGTPPIPEPASLPLLGLGAGALLLRRRR